MRTSSRAWYELTAAEAETLRRLEAEHDASGGPDEFIDDVTGYRTPLHPWTQIARDILDDDRVPVCKGWDRGQYTRYHPKHGPVHGFGDTLAGEIPWR